MVCREFSDIVLHYTSRSGKEVKEKFEGSQEKVSSA